jgi:hypothetical protein
MNRPVTITAVRFDDRFDMIPRRIELDGISYDLTDTERPLTDSEKLLEMSDGVRLFRLLRGLTTTDWKLLSITV